MDLKQRDESEVTADVTVYRVTGFVGKHVCWYLLDTAAVERKPLRISLAGHEQARLEAQKDSIEAKDSSVDVFVADSSDPLALKKMVERTRVVINCTGPFIKYSSNVVAACTDIGADHVDITGEITWHSVLGPMTSP